MSLPTELPAFTFRCKACGRRPSLLASECTLTLTNERFWLLSHCDEKGVTVRSPIPIRMLPDIIDTPVLLDPDVRDYLREVG